MEVAGELRMEDGGLVLRPLRLDDVAAVTAACQDQEIVRWTVSIPSPYEEVHARTWIERHDSLRGPQSDGERGGVGPRLRCCGPRRGGVMDERVTQVSSLLHEAGETHHQVFRIVDGADDDWASWYADWLINLSELPGLVGTKPVRSELVWLLVRLDKDYTAEQPKEQWEDWYAAQVVRHFGA